MLVDEKQQDQHEDPKDNSGMAMAAADFTISPADVLITDAHHLLLRTFA